MTTELRVMMVELKDGLQAETVKLELDRDPVVHAAEDHAPGERNDGRDEQIDDVPDVRQPSQNRTSRTASIGGVIGFPVQS